MRGLEVVGSGIRLYSLCTDSKSCLRRLVSRLPQLRRCWFPAGKPFQLLVFRFLALEPSAREESLSDPSNTAWNELAGRQKTGRQGRTVGAERARHRPCGDHDNSVRCKLLLEARELLCVCLAGWQTSHTDWSKVCQGHLAEAVDALDRLLQRVPYVHTFAFYAVLKRCIAQRDLFLGIRVHLLVVKSRLESNVFLANHIICMYTSHGMLEEATRVFSKVAVPNRHMWASIILAHGRHGQPVEAIKLYARMRGLKMMPDNHIFVAVLNACAMAQNLSFGKKVHSHILGTADEPDMFVWNALLDMYAKCRSLEDAKNVFDSLQTRDVVTWNAMIAGYAQHGLGEEALTLYDSMQQEGVTRANAVTFVSLLQAVGNLAGMDKGKEIHAQIRETGIQASELPVANALVDMYGRCGSVVDAQQVFDALPTRDVVTWSALIAAYARLGESRLVFDLFHRMIQEGVKPNSITFLSLLTVCSHVGLVDKGQKCFEAMSRVYNITPGIEHYNCMVDLLGRAGLVHKAMEMVRTMPFQPHGGLWKSVLNSCRKWKHVELGREAFQCAVTLDSKDSAPYVLMSNIYAAAHMWEEAKDIDLMRAQSRAWNNPGQTWWVDRVGTMHTFVVGHTEHPERQHIHANLGCLFFKLKDDG